MKLNDAKNIMFGNRQVKKVYLGEHLIWPTESQEPSIPGFKRLLAIESVKLGQKFLPYINLNYLFTSLTSITLEFEITNTEENIYNIFGCRSYLWCLRENIPTDGITENSLVYCNGNFNSGSGNKDILYKSVLQPNKRYVLQTNRFNCVIYEVGNLGNRHEWRTSYAMTDYQDLLTKSNGVYLYGLKIGASDHPSVVSQGELSKQEFTACGMRIYSCTVWEGSKLVRNLHPVRNTKTSEFGLYDYENNVFYRKVMTLGESIANHYFSDYVGIEK